MSSPVLPNLMAGIYKFKLFNSFISKQTDCLIMIQCVVAQCRAKYGERCDTFESISSWGCSLVTNFVCSFFVFVIKWLLLLASLCLRRVRLVRDWHRCCLLSCLLYFGIVKNLFGWPFDVNLRCFFLDRAFADSVDVVRDTAQRAAKALVAQFAAT